MVMAEHEAMHPAAIDEGLDGGVALAPVRAAFSARVAVHRQVDAAPQQRLEVVDVGSISAVTDADAVHRHAFFGEDIDLPGADLLRRPLVRANRTAGADAGTRGA